MNSSTLSSQGDAEGFYTTLVNNEFIDFSSNPLNSVTIESDGGILPLKINNTNDIIHTRFCIITDMVIKSIQVMLPAGTKIKWTSTLIY